MKEITLGQVLDAIEQNGLEQITGSYFRYSNGSTYFNNGAAPIGACAIGQGAINLHVDADALVGALDKLIKVNQNGGLGNSIIRANDSKGWTFKEIATHYRNKYSRRLNDIVMRIND